MVSFCLFFMVSLDLRQSNGWCKSKKTNGVLPGTNNLCWDIPSPLPSPHSAHPNNLLELAFLATTCGMLLGICSGLEVCGSINFCNSAYDAIKRTLPLEH